MIGFITIHFDPTHNPDANQIQSHFRHPAGDLASLLQIYRGYTRLTKRTVNTPGPEDPIANASVGGAGAGDHATRPQWCRAHLLNSSRLSTACRVRGQLKDLVRGVGLGSCFRSCGQDLTSITRAFLASGFRDQVCLLFFYSSILNCPSLVYYIMTRFALLSSSVMHHSHVQNAVG